MANTALNLLLFLPLLPFVPSAQGTDERATDDRPNLLLMVTDDHPHDAMGCAGHPVLQTPHMDALAVSGVRFTHAFVTTPICAASRASIFTGQYEGSHGYTFGQPPLAAELVNASYPVLLREAGYRVGFVGKLGVRIREDSRKAMFDSFVAGTYPYFRKQKDPAATQQRHLTETNVDRALEFIQSSNGQPSACLSPSRRHTRKTPIQINTYGPRAAMVCTWMSPSSLPSPPTLSSSSPCQRSCGAV